jgi:hypothetical protein
MAPRRTGDGTARIVTIRNNWIYTITMSLPTALTRQYEAALCMLNDCLAQCPPDQWNAPVARYAFWEVAYHTLCFVDLYLSPAEASFQPRPDLHPAGLVEFDNEHPSRPFSQPELLRYLQICLDKARTTLAPETGVSLESPSNFPGRPSTRLELHLYNIRHIQHHTGQLSAHLRRTTPTTNPRWIGSGWKQHPTPK